MERKDESVPYVPFKSERPRYSRQADTETDLLDRQPAFVSLPPAEKPDISVTTEEDVISPSSIRVESGCQHAPDDRDPEEVLEPWTESRDEPAKFLQSAWGERPVRKFTPTITKSEDDVKKDKFIKVLRMGGEFLLTFGKIKGRRMHVRVSDDLTQLLWNEPKKKKTDEINVFEIEDVKEVDPTAFSLTMIIGEGEMKLQVVSDNSVDRLLDVTKPLSIEEKTNYWKQAFHSLVKMQLQSKIYK